MRYHGPLLVTLQLLLAARCAWSSRVRLRSQQERAPYKQELHNYQNVQYFADFEIGGQKIAGIFDTGSFELLVRSSRCDHCVHPTPPYDHERSDTYQKNGTVAKHVFGSGPCVSMMGYESVTVGGALHTERQAFWEIVDHRIRVLDTARFAAIVGIGPNFAYENKEKTLLMSYGVDAFSICLQRQSGSVGFLTWDVPEEREGRIAVPVIGKHHWVTRLQDVTFRKPLTHLESVPCGDERGCAAIVDSGTSLLALPHEVINRLVQVISDPNLNCSNMLELPHLVFDMNGKTFSLPPDVYVTEVTYAVPSYLQSFVSFRHLAPELGGNCDLYTLETNVLSHKGAWIFGLPWFRKYYTSFPVGNNASDLAVYIAGASELCTPMKSRVQVHDGPGRQWRPSIDPVSVRPNEL